MHQQDHQSTNFERDIADDLAVGMIEKDYAFSSTGGGNKVKLPEIGYGVSHSTEMPEGFQKLNNATAVNNHPIMNNFNSDPYALRIK